MKPITEAEIKKHISAKNFLNTYLVFGDDAYLKQLYVNQIINQTVASTSDFNLDIFDSKFDVRDLGSAVAQLPFMCEKRCVVVSDVDFESLDQKTTTALTDIIAEQYENTVLVFWLDNVEVNIKKAAKLKKFIGIIEKNRGCAVELNHRTENELEKIIINGVEKRNCEIDYTAPRYLIQVCGRDLMTLQSEIEKLCSYAADALITREMIDHVSIRTVDANIYDLAKAIGAGDGDTANAILTDLFYERVAPQIILSTLSDNYIAIYNAKAADDIGLRPESIAAELGYAGREFVLKNAARTANRMNIKQVHNCLQILVDADLSLKSIRAHDKDAYSKLILEKAVAQLMMCVARR